MNIYKHANVVVICLFIRCQRVIVLTACIVNVGCRWLFAVGSLRSARRARYRSNATTSSCELASSSSTWTASVAPSVRDASPPVTNSLWHPATGSAAEPTSTPTSLPPEVVTSRLRRDATRLTMTSRRQRLTSDSSTTITKTKRKLPPTTSRVSLEMSVRADLNLTLHIPL